MNQKTYRYPSTALAILAISLTGGCTRLPAPEVMASPYLIQDRRTPYNPEIQPETAAYYEKELQYIESRRTAVERIEAAAPDAQEAAESRTIPYGLDFPRTGLVLSGGGLRSASFNLGVLQCLQDLEYDTENDISILERIDYLSAVSGGAYVASWLVGRILAQPCRTQSATPTDDTAAPRSTQTRGSAPCQNRDGNHQRHQYDNQARRFDADGLLTAASDSWELLAGSDFLSYRLGERLEGGSRGWGDPHPVEHLQNNASHLLNQNTGGYTELIAEWIVRYPLNLLFSFGLHFKPVRGDLNLHHMYLPYLSRLEHTYFDGIGSGSDFWLAGNAALAKTNPTGSRAPYLIIGATLNNIGRTDRDFPVLRARRVSGMDVSPSYRTSPFEFTRDYCGAPGIGYLPTEAFNMPVVRVYEKRADQGTVLGGVLVSNEDYGFWKATGITLSQATAASGAALSPQGNSSSTNWVVAYVQTFLATLFNVNIQYQSRNFSQSLTAWWAQPLDRIREVSTDRFCPTVKSNTLLISDGGHYDNLGVAALVRRRVPRIVVFDASADGNYEYESLRQSIRAVRNEGCSRACGGYRWKFAETDCPQFGCKPPSYAMRGAIMCECADAIRMDVIYCKATILDGEIEHAGHLPDYPLRYRSNNPAFPHHSTLFQWYDWSRFEAYRQLGYGVAASFFCHFGKDFFSNCHDLGPDRAKLIHPFRDRL